MDGGVVTLLETMVRNRFVRMLVALAVPRLEPVQPKESCDEQNESEDHQLQAVGSTGAKRAW